MPPSPRHRSDPRLGNPDPSGASVGGRSAVPRRAVLLGVAAGAGGVVGATGLARVAGSEVPSRRQAPGLVPFSYDTSAFRLDRLPPQRRPYARTAAVPVQDRELHDASGVRLFRWKGTPHDHPVAQAQYGLALLESHRLTRKPEYLRRAGLQAQRLVTRRVLREGAWFYPYAFGLPVHGNGEQLSAPWYSMMAQGQALSLFARLAEVTGQARWRTAAAATFAGYLLKPRVGAPWGVYVRDGLLWLEEYPSTSGVGGDLTYNGHVFSLFGLYDYTILTGDPRAAALTRGALVTAQEAMPRIRRPGRRSRYCARHDSDAGKYHAIHIDQHLLMLDITGDPAFARIADQLYADAPTPSAADRPLARTPEQVYLAAGEHEAVTFDKEGGVPARRRVRLARSTTQPLGRTGRGRVPGQPQLWYELGDGPLAGWSVAELPGVRHQVGLYAAMAYPRRRPATVRGDRPLALAVTEEGGVRSTGTTLTAGTDVTVDARGVIDGVEHLRLASGPWRGSWVVTPSLAVR